MMGNLLSVSSILQQSEVNGPGERLVIWTQGCTKACPGCFNPETWKFTRRSLWDSVELAEKVFSSNPEGLTITGGDPLEQPEALLEFLRALHKDEHPEYLPSNFLPRGIICFTGFEIEEISGAALECLKYIDLLIDGRYIEALRYTSGLAGSSNQRFHFNQIPGRGEVRLRREEIEIDQSIEVHLDETDADGVIVTGFPLINRRFLRELGLTVQDSSVDKVE